MAAPGGAAGPVPLRAAASSVSPAAEGELHYGRPHVARYARTDSHNGKPARAEPEDDMKNALAGGSAAGGQVAAGTAGPTAGRHEQRPPRARPRPGETVPAAVQLAIGLLTGRLDSSELEAWTVEALAPSDADGLGNLMAGMHVVSELRLHELHEATGEPPEAILQILAILAEHWRGMPSAG
jgi:hypothetical protein